MGNVFSCVFSDFDIRQESICQIEKFPENAFHAVWGQIFPVLCPSLSGEGCHHLAIVDSGKPKGILNC